MQPDRFFQRRRSMLFNITHDIFQLIAMSADNHVDMACHDAPCVYFKALILLAMPPRIQHNIPVFVTYKKVYPVYHGKADKVRVVLIAEFIVSAHYSLKIPQSSGKTSPIFLKAETARLNSASKPREAFAHVSARHSRGRG